MSRTISSRVGGFTPIIDVVVQGVGLIAAAVYGRVWRYCQMEDGVCTASLETIGDEVGLNRRTVLRHIKDLCQNGYLEDMTPDLRNKPHTYRDTRKVIIEGEITAKVNGVTESHSDVIGVTESHTGVTESHTGVTESPSGSDLKSLEETDNSRDNSRDPATDIFDFAHRDGPELPRGWGGASEDEFEVCKHVAYLWKDNVLPRRSDEIEKQLAGAAELLAMHDGDRLRTFSTIDAYYASGDGRDLWVAGPQSLTNVLPNFMARSRPLNGPRVLRIGR